MVDQKGERAVRDAASRWVQLRSSGYFGRNLIVQGMYFGKLRYWLYSLPMGKQTITERWPHI